MNRQSITADCEDCEWSFDGQDILVVQQKLGEHREETGHDVEEPRRVATDGGSKYVNETGEGYLGIIKLSDYHLSIPFGAWPEYQWEIGDDLWAIDQEDGFAIVDEEPDEDPLGMPYVKIVSVGPCVKVPTKVARGNVDVPPHADIRIYRHESGGMHIVPADPDPMLVTDGGVDEIPDEEIEHRCVGAGKQLRIIRRKLETIDPEIAGEIEDLEAEIHGLEERLKSGGGDEAVARDDHRPMPDGGRKEPWGVVD